MWLPMIVHVLQCRYREMGAQVEARLRSFTSRREFVEKTSYDDVSSSFACLTSRVQQSLLELRALVCDVSHCCVKSDCVQGACSCGPRPGK